MNFEYSITGANRATGQIYVRYKTEANLVGWLWTVDVPIKDGAFIVGAELDAHIRATAPTHLFERAALIASLDFSSIEAQVEPPEPTEFEIGQIILDIVTF